jgi:hypothetical protein
VAEGVVEVIKMIQVQQDDPRGRTLAHHYRAVLGWGP